jgi:hypothetical protein
VEDSAAITGVELLQPEEDSEVAAAPAKASMVVAANMVAANMAAVGMAAADITNSHMRRSQAAPPHSLLTLARPTSTFPTFIRANELYVFAKLRLAIGIVSRCR